MRVSEVRPRLDHRVPLAIIFSTVVMSQTTPGVRYKVQLYGSGEWHCDCPGYHYYGRCKHADAEQAHYEARKTLPLSALL